MPALVDIHNSFLKRCAAQEILWAGDRLAISCDPIKVMPNFHIHPSPSAGGVIAIGLAYAAHQRGITLPQQIIAISPGVNIAQNKPAEEIAKIQPNDSMLTPESTLEGRRMWAGLPPDGSVPFPASVLEDAAMNPIVGDPAIFRESGTQLVIASGTYDTLHPYVYDFVEKVEQADVRSVYIEGRGQLHVFPLARALVKEGEEAAQAIVESVLSFSM